MFQRQSKNARKSDTTENYRRGATLWLSNLTCVHNSPPSSSRLYHWWPVPDFSYPSYLKLQMWAELENSPVGGMFGTEAGQSCVQKDLMNQGGHSFLACTSLNNAVEISSAVPLSYFTLRQKYWRSNLNWQKSSSPKNRPGDRADDTARKKWTASNSAVMTDRGGAK